MPDLTIPGGGDIVMRAYLALPAVGRGPWPGVIVIHDAFGLTTLARTHAERLKDALTERRILHDVNEYPEAGHSFLDRFNVGPFLPVVQVAGFGYHQPSAEDAWRRILRFFADQLQPAHEA